jgi:hypothetical protein
VECVTIADVTSGFLPRFLPVVAQGPTTRKPFRVLSQETEQARTHLAGWLTDLRGNLKEGPITISPEALARVDAADVTLDEWALQQFEVDLVLPWARRLVEYVFRLGILYATSERAERVDRIHVLRALVIVDRAKEDVLMLVEELTKGKEARERDRVEQFIKANPGSTVRDICRSSSLPSSSVSAHVRELSVQGRVTPLDEGKTTRYYATGSAA